MNPSIGLIGVGSMGSALARAVCKAVEPERVLLANRTPEKAQILARELGCRCGSNEAAAQCRYIFLGVKPQMMAGLLGSIAPVLSARSDDFVLVTMAAGLSCSKIREMAGLDCPVIRMMPNTPAQIGQGVIQVCALGASEEEMEEFVRLIAPAGLVDQIPEGLIDAASALSGSGPAYMYIFLEALADSAVACGIPRAKAYEYAAMTMVGSAEMYLQTKQHPGALKDAVCSPGGSTIAGVKALEEGAFRASVMNCVTATCNRNKELGK